MGKLKFQFLLNSISLIPTPSIRANLNKNLCRTLCSFLQDRSIIFIFILCTLTRTSFTNANYSHLRNASESSEVYKPWKGGAGHVWRHWASALKMQNNQSFVRDCGTVMFFCGKVPQNVGRLASMYMYVVSPALAWRLYQVPIVSHCQSCE